MPSYRRDRDRASWGVLAGRFVKVNQERGVMGGFEGPSSGGGLGGPIITPPPVVLGGGGSASGPSVGAALGQVIAYVTGSRLWGQAYADALLGGLRSALKSIFQQTLAWLDWLRRNWLGQIVKGIYDKLKAIFTAVQTEIRRVMAIIQAYERLVRYWEQRILAPILNVIQALRRTLVIFRIFHLRFATRLDQYLAGVEGRLSRIFLFYQKELNKIIDALDLIVDPFGLFNEAMYLKSALRSLGDLWAAIMGFPSATLTAAQDAAAVTRAGFYDAKSQKQYAKELAAGGVPPEDQAIIENDRLGYAKMGYNV
jgi:hypothetical protein